MVIGQITYGKRSYDRSQAIINICTPSPRLFLRSGGRGVHERMRTEGHVQYDDAHGLIDPRGPPPYLVTTRTLNFSSLHPAVCEIWPPRLHVRVLRTYP